jgi:Holliday junction resolvase RusA-like endonuclease
MYADLFIKGIPYGQGKTTGDTEGHGRWTEAVKQATESLPPVKRRCSMIVVFVLPENKFPNDLPEGPDLDNLMKLLLDALNDTVFSKAKGKDSCVVQLVVSKHKALQNEPLGARVIIADRGE